MEKQVIKTSLSEISPLINGCFDDGLDVVLTVTGNSMQPLLEHNRDQVILQKPEVGKLKKGDVPLYIRKNGQYVLHRIVAVNDGVYTMLGDAQSVLEKGIKPEQIVAVVRGIYRKDRFIDCNSVIYRQWVGLWWHLRRIRPYLLKAHRIAKKICDGKKAK